MDNVSLISESQIKQIHSPALHIPQMSETALKRWYETRDAYLGQQYPYVEEHQRIKRKVKTIKHEETPSVFTLESERFSKPDLQILSLDKEQPQQKTRIIRDHFDDKCVGTEINEPSSFKTDTEQIDQAVQVDLPSPKFELHHEYDTSMVEGEKNQRIQYNQETIEYSDKAIETDPVLNLETENNIPYQSTEKTKIQSIPNVSNQIVSLNNPIIDRNDDDEDTKTIISSTESNTSISQQLLKYFSCTYLFIYFKQNLSVIDYEFVSNDYQKSVVY